MPQHQTETPAGDPADALVADTSEGLTGAEVSWLREQARLVEIE